MQEIINRIQLMEQYFDTLQEAVESNPNIISECNFMKEMMSILTSYYESDQWMQDYELDEKGFLPANLKRGVLSQDAIYNFLENIK